MFDWNDLRYLLAVSHHGSTLAAGRALGVDQSTVQRRLAELERRTGVVMARREPGGYRLTDAGRELLERAELVQQAITAFEQQVATVRDSVTGVVRVTCPEPLAQRLSRSALIERFHAEHPGLHVEFVLSDRYLDLRKGDADVALRSGDTDDGELIGRRIGDSLWAVYASRHYLEQHGRPQASAQFGADFGTQFGAHSWIGFDDSMASHRAAVWLRAMVPDARIVARNSSVLGIVSSAKAGLGLAALPTAIADAEPDLERVLGPIPEMTRFWRILTTHELRKQARVAAFFDYIVTQVDALRPIITG